MKKKGNKIISIIALLISAYFANNYIQENDDTRINTSSNSQSKTHQPKKNNTDELANLIKNKQSDKIITINAKVINILSDDTQGDKHQRLILKVGEHTLLLAHNIDLAPRVPVKKGEIIQVKGEYEWNEKGGVIHWTHRSNNNHANGWIKYNNKKYH